MKFVSVANGEELTKELGEAKLSNKAEDWKSNHISIKEHTITTLEKISLIPNGQNIGT